MKTPKIREALTRLATAGTPFDEGLADAALNELRTLEAERSIATSTLRDTFAAAALTGILANPATPDGIKINGVETSAMNAAWAIADAMLAAREGK